MAEQSPTSRSARHDGGHKKKKKGNFGKNIFTLVTLLLVVGLGFGAYYLYDIKKQEVQAQERFDAVTKTLLAEIQEERNQSGIASKKETNDDKQIKTVIYVPEDGQKVPVENPKAELNKLVKNAEKTIKADQKAVIVARLDVKTLSDQLDEYQLVADRYTWSDTKNDFTKETASDEKAQYIYHKTGKAVTFKDLIPDESSLLGVQQVIQQQLLDTAKDKNAVIDKVINLPRISFKSQITYTPDEFKIELPKNDLDVKEITLKYKDIASYINTSLVNQDTIKDAFPALEDGKKYVALTFDDGPNPSTTPKVLDILKEKNAHATFFLLGENVVQNKDLVKRIYDEGNEVASHSYSHPFLPGLTDKQVTEETHKTDKAIFEACGVLPRNIRAPYGSANQTVADIVGKPFINWNVDSEDWKSKNAATIKAQIKNNLAEGAIVLMHDIQPATVEALPDVIDNMRKEGYEFVSVDTMLQKKQKPLYQYFGADDFRLVDK